MSVAAATASISPAQLQAGRSGSFHHPQGIAIAPPPPSAIAMADLNLMGPPGSRTGPGNPMSNGNGRSSGMVFHASDSSGTNFTSPFGDLQLLPAELHSAFGRRLTDMSGMSSGRMALSDDVVASDDEDDEEDDSVSPATPSQPSRGQAHAQRERRGSKASSAASSSQGSNVKSKSTAVDGEATPKSTAVKGKSKSSSAAPGSLAASTASSAKKPSKTGSEVKGERDSLTGRRKIKIQFIEDDSRRHITFSKRKAGIMKKAYELSVLTGTQVLLLIVSQTGLVFTFTTPKLRPVVMETEGRELIQRCLSAPDDEDDEAGDEEDGGMQGMEGGEDDDDDEAGDGSDVDDDEDEIVRSSGSRSPSKAPVAIIRPGPTMTANGGTPKRSGGGTGDGGAAGRRSRAATISNATVRQHMNQVGSPEQAVTGLSVPNTPATPSTAARSRKRRRTAADGMGAPAALSAALAGPSMPASAVTTSSSASGSLFASPSTATTSLHHGNSMDPPHSAPSALTQMPNGQYSLQQQQQQHPPPQVQQTNFYRGADNNNSSFLLGPNGGIDPISTGGGTVNTEFFFSPVDMSKQQTQLNMSQHGGQSMHHQHQPHPGMNFGHSQHGSTYSMHSVGSTPGLASPHTSSGPPSGSSAGFSPHNAHFPSFGQAYNNLQPGSGDMSGGHGQQSGVSMTSMPPISQSTWSDSVLSGNGPHDFQTSSSAMVNGSGNTSFWGQ